jgi:hypothetical protein
MNHLNKLPDEIYEYIVWLSCGPINLEISNKAKKICEEVNYYKNIRLQFDVHQIWHLYKCEKYGLDAVYLKRIIDYRKTPELDGYKPIFAHVSNGEAKTLRVYFALLFRTHNGM